ncbi:MAG: serine/threonine protein kinase, partial [Intrasporangium sp.]|uniref:serine/threonine-protein kinase n=1 Tax=Intrasporangium sp. TaxID=1925024 RepID=UPI00264892A2
MATDDRTERVTTTLPTGAQSDGSGCSGDGRQPQRLGRYRLIEEIGEGGMGVVHLGLDPRGRAVAIKVLRTHVAVDPDARDRLGREVETLSLIRDDRVAGVLDADVMGPRPYIVTRYVAGPSLDEVVARDGRFEPEALLRLARGVAEAIRAIHSCGVVHRDIKPGNVLIEDGEPVLIDFGIAHLQDDVRHTVGGLVMGTPGYLSPELVEGAAITDATDWWGWAATITYAASGRPPFGRGRMDAVLSRVRAGEVDLTGVDPRLVPLLRASLCPDPGDRPHADDVLRALESFASGHAAPVPEPYGQVWAAPPTHRAPPPRPPPGAGGG